MLAYIFSDQLEDGNFKYYLPRGCHARRTMFSRTTYYRGRKVGGLSDTLNM